MNAKNYVLLLLVVLAGACGDEEKSSPKEQFLFGDKNISLENAYLYTVPEAIADDHIHRWYFISDGEYEWGVSHLSGSYKNATFAIWIKLGAPIEEEEMTAGEFPSRAFPLDYPVGSRFATVIYDEVGAKYYTPNDVESGTPVVVRGGFEPGSTISISYDGQLTWMDDETEEQQTFTGKLYIKSKVLELPEIEP